MRGMVAATPVAALCSAFVCVAIAFGEPAAPQAQDLPKTDQPKTQAPPPKQDSIALDPVNVQKAKTAKRKKRQTKAAVRPAAPLPAQPPSAARETAYSAVKGYVAGRSATGTKTDTPIREIPQSITVVTTDRMQDQGITTVQEALRYIPGVTADPYGPDSRNDAVLVRGASPEWYLDGMRVINSWWNGQRVDPYMLSRVEVLRGPSSVLYGSTTTAGLINMISKLPQERELHEIGIQYGSFNRKQIQTDHSGKITADGQWLYRFVGIWRGSDMQTDFVPDDRIVAMPALTWRPTKDTDWTVIATYQKDRTGSSTAFLPHSGTIFANPNGKIPVNRFTSEPGFDRYQTETKSVASIFEHRFGDMLKIRQSTRYSHVDGVYNTLYPDNYSNPTNPYVDPAMRSVFRYAQGSQTSRDTLTSDTNAELKFETGALKHKVLAGVDFRGMKETGSVGYSYITTPFDLYSPTYTGIVPPTQAPIPALNQQQTGVYVQDQLRFGPWIAVLGLRHDKVRNDQEGSPLQQDSATSGRAGLMYELPFGLTPYVTYAQSFNPIFGAFTCAGFCKPQRGELYESGFKYKASRDLVINGALFDITEKNRLAADPNNPLLSIQTGKVRIRGAELELLATVFNDLDLIGAYTYLDTEVLSGSNAGKRIETVPMHQASLWAKYRFALWGIPGFSVGAGVRYIGPSWDGTDTIETPGYVLYDAMLAYENANWRFQISGANLADNIHLTTCLARGDCFYGVRRMILSSLTYKF
jgi:iron complex outermembrane receptor protein